MLKTSSVIHPAAAHSSSTTIFLSGIFRRRDDAIHALPSPMPKMNAMSTTANDCSDEPKIIASERDASTSSPIETAPDRQSTRLNSSHVRDEATPSAVV